MGLPEEDVILRAKTQEPLILLMGGFHLVTRQLPLGVNE